MLVCGCVVGLSKPCPAGLPHVAVFNFQMKTVTPTWLWLEKGLADKITTDFTRSRRITVIARDEMQLLAERLRWVPEMATRDAATVGRIRRALGIDTLVTGVFSVRDKQVEIVAQVIRVSDRKEVTRRIVRGSTAEILSLQRKLSAELLGWFSGVPVRTILPQLPVWTTSVEATRALYEGLDLYDQGRYPEAWLRFRSAWRNDPTYLEAHYWVARMYYFMDRYEHARRAYEKFVYMDDSHPRIGDAIKEYLHTHEKLGAGAKALLDLYDAFMRRFPDVPIHRELQVHLPATVRSWLMTRSAQVLEQMGEYRRAVELASGAMSLMPPVLCECTGGWPYYIARNCARELNRKAGEVLVPPGLQRYFHDQGRPNVLRFTADKPEAVATKAVPLRCVRLFDRAGNPRYKPIMTEYWLLPPENHIFRRLTIYPIIEGDDGTLTCWIRMARHGEVPGVRDVPISEVREKGVVFEDLPRSGILDVCFLLSPKQQDRDPRIQIKGVRAVAELEEVGRHGMVEVEGVNTDQFVVRVDGRYGRRGPGTLGLLPPGERHLAIHPATVGTPYGTVKRTVQVQAGQTTRVRVSLPWKAGTPASAWPTATRIASSSSKALRSPCLQAPRPGRPSVLADDSGIRVFWSWRGDLWTSRSTDGQRFSAARQIPMPISSGWLEQHPLALRDETGKLWLFFRSDRDSQHRSLVYACWSRDGLRWSRPVQVVNRPVDQFNCIRTADGHLLWADMTLGTATIMRSRNALRWKTLAQWPINSRPSGVILRQGADGGFDLFASGIFFTTGHGTLRLGYTHVWHRQSRRGPIWSPVEEIARYRGVNGVSLSVVPMDGRMCVMFVRYAGDDLRVFRQLPDRTWEQGWNFDCLTSRYATVVFHPKWKYVIAWIAGRDEGATVLRVDSLDGFFEKEGAAK